MAAGVLGSGFGLYGYLPALAKTEDVVFVLEKARQRIEDRNELADFRNKIQYVESLTDILGKVDKLVVALPPVIQLKIITENDLSGIKLFLEKPLGENLEAHSQLLNLLIERKLIFKVAYLFLYTEWFDYIARSTGKNFQINWTIPRVVSDWKISLISEFGIESYYGMHFYPIYRYLGIAATDLRISDTVDAMRIIDSRGRLDIFIEIGELHKFEVLAHKGSEKHTVFSAQSPFGNLPKSGFTDPRVRFLSRYMSESDETLSEKSSFEIEEFIIQCRAIKRNSETC